MVDHARPQHIAFLDEAIGAEEGIDVNRQRLPGHQNAGVPRRANAGADNINVGEVGEPVEHPAGVEEAPIENLEGAQEAAVEVQPALADEGVVEVLRERELGENQEEELVGEEGGEIGPGRGREREGEVGLGGRRGCGGGGSERLCLHLEDCMLQSLLFRQHLRQAQRPRPLQLWLSCASPR